MTREEAILKIEYIRDGNDFTPTDAQVKAMNMAIEALQTDGIICPQCGKVFGEPYQKIVRCKDCRHQEFYWNSTESFHCDKAHIANMHMDDGKGDFFCAYGERKGGDTE